MKRSLAVIINYLLLIINLSSSAQEPLSLQKAYELAQQNYPMIKQLGLVKQTTNLSIENLNKGFLPQFSLNGQASYQSDVTKVDVPIPGITIPSLSKDQYKATVDMNQLIYDGGAIKQQKNIQQLNDSVEEEKVEVELYKIKERINQLFLGILFIDDQLKQVDLTKEDLNIGIKRVEAQVNNGVSLRSNLQVLQAQLLQMEQRAIELKATRKGLVDVLAIFINQQLPENIQLERPLISPVIANDVQRPELKLYSLQNNLLSGQTRLIDAKNLPKASFFAQGGYGRPGLNQLKDEFQFYYITGVRLNWSFGGLYTQKREKKLIDVNKKIVDIQKETFLLNTNTALKQQQSEIDKFQQLVKTDQQIIDLRIKVKEAAKAQLENGVITANDYLREVNAEDQARQNLILHQTQLLQAQINYQTIEGKQ